MKKLDFVDSLERMKLNMEKVEKISSIYERNLPDLVEKIISVVDKPVFFEDGFRLLAFSEIENATDEFGVDFPGLGLLPVIDCYDNDFIAFDLNNEKWAKYSISDECLFKVRDELEDLLG